MVVLRLFSYYRSQQKILQQTCVSVSTHIMQQRVKKTVSYKTRTCRFFIVKIVLKDENICCCMLENGKKKKVYSFTKDLVTFFSMLFAFSLSEYMPTLQVCG